MRALRKQLGNEFLGKFVQLEEKLLKACQMEATPDLMEGCNLIHRLLLSNLEKHGVHFYEPQPNDPFNP